MDDFCGTVSSWKHYIMTNWVTPQGGGMCVTGRIAKGKAMHTHSFSFLLCHSQLCLLAIIFFQFVLIDISARFSLILLPFFVHVVLQLLHHFLCLSHLTCFASISCTSGSLSPPPSLSWGQRHPRLLLLPSFLSSFSLPPFTSIGCLLLCFPSLLWFFPPLESHSSCCLLCICVCQCSRGL